jgi:hypothetical protein
LDPAARSNFSIDPFGGSGSPALSREWLPASGPKRSNLHDPSFFLS